MRRLILILLLISTLSAFFVSCSNLSGNVVEYPDIYTLEYCSANYIDADPNLLYTVSADNSIGKIDVSGGYASYYAIKDVPIDDYLLLDEAIMFVPLSYKIVKNKNNTKLPQQEILSYEIKSITIYSLSDDLDALDKRALGDKMVEEIIACIDNNEASAFQDYIIDCIETKNYKTAGIAGDAHKPVEGIHLRVVFECYENLVWDSGIYEQNDIYYIVFYTPADSPNGGWVQNWMPINQELAELIP